MVRGLPEAGDQRHRRRFGVVSGERAARKRSSSTMRPARCRRVRRPAAPRRRVRQRHIPNSPVIPRTSGPHDGVDAGVASVCLAPSGAATLTATRWPQHPGDVHHPARRARSRRRIPPRSARSTRSGLLQRQNANPRRERCLNESRSPVRERLPAVELRPRALRQHLGVHADRARRCRRPASQQPPSAPRLAPVERAAGTTAAPRRGPRASCRDRGRSR